MKTTITAITLILVSLGLSYFKIIDYGYAWIVISLCILAIPQRDTQRKVIEASKNPNIKSVSIENLGDTIE